MKELEQFIHDCQRRTLGGHAWIRVNRMHAYLRYGQRYIDGIRFNHVLDIANIRADKPGTGAFKELILYLRTRRPELNIYVECVQTKKFECGLLRLGFTEVSGAPQCFWLPAV